VTVKQLKCQALYFHTKNASPDDGSGFNTGCFTTAGNTDADNDLYTNLTCSDVDICSSIVGSNTEISYSYAYNCSRCFAGTPRDTSSNTTGSLFHHLEIGDRDVWDATDDNYHHSPIVMFNGPTVLEVWSNIKIYDNYVHGNSGGNSTTNGMQCNTSASASILNRVYADVYVFNNIFTATVAGDATLGCNGAGIIFANNTIYVSPLSGSGSCINVDLDTSDSTFVNPTAIKNNLCRTASGISARNYQVPYPDRTVYDYNIYAGAGTSNSFTCQTGNVNAFSNIQLLDPFSSGQQICGIEAHGTNPNSGDDSGSAAAVNLNLSTFAPQAGSILTGAGTNLTSLCSTVAELCSDFYGTARPAVGAWDVGAVQASTATVSTLRHRAGLLIWAALLMAVSAGLLSPDIINHPQQIAPPVEHLSKRS
jgi:hypothetical protein